MGVFYFTLLSDLLNATKLKYDYDIEDANLLANISTLFKKRTLRETDQSQLGSKTKVVEQKTSEYCIDGIIRLSRLS